MRKTVRSLVLFVALQAAAFAVATSAEAARSVPPTGYEPGTIVVKTSERKLYLILPNGDTLSYPVAVGKTGKTWSGSAQISGKFLKPAWSPPAEIRLDNPRIPDVIASGAPENPMGDAAMTLSGGEYAIHGTNNPASIGHYASYGCIRMYNADIMDLFQRVNVGTRVVVLK